MNEKQGVKKNKWITFIVICLTCGIITELPYLRWALYEPLREALGQTNTQFGMSMSIFGTLSAILYIPGGWLADRVSHRKLFTLSAIGCGLLGIWFSTMPSYSSTLIIHALWAITNIGMFWPTMTKAISLLDDSEGQGKIFGLFEGARGVFVLILWLVLMQMFERFGGIRSVILTLAIASIVCGVICFFFMEDNVNTETKSDNSVIKDMLTVLKMPSVWLVSGVIFTIYAAYSSSSYMQSYAQNILGMSAVAAGYVGILRKDVIRLVAAPLSGLISQKIGGKCTLLIGVFDIIFLISLFALIGLPVGAEYTVISVVIMLVSSFAIYGMRGMYYAIIGEIGTPKAIYGSVAGIAMFIGFLPDAFNATLCGYMLDTFPGALGYRYIFIYMAGSIVVCLGLVMLLLRQIKKNNSTNKEISGENLN
ncbi:MAG: MFS transporter [Peptostreptococcaceae bacterium]